MSHQSREFILLLLFINIVLFSMRTIVNLFLLRPLFLGPCNYESVVWGELAWEAACFTNCPGDREPWRMTSGALPSESF